MTQACGRRIARLHGCASGAPELDQGLMSPLSTCLPGSAVRKQKQAAVASRSSSFYRLLEIYATASGIATEDQGAAGAHS